MRSRTAGRGEVIAVYTVFLAFTANFGAYRVFGDGVDYYSFVQRLFGDRTTGSGYNFGTGLMNAPFYGVARIVQAAVGPQADRLLPASITVGSIAYGMLTIAVSAWLLRQLGFHHGELFVVLAIFGSPVWYYMSFSPAYSHAADAATFSVAACALWQVFTSDRIEWRVAAGAALGLAIAVRPFNLAFIVGAIIGLAAYKRFRDAILIGGFAILTIGTLLLVPYALGTGLRRRADGQLVAGNHLGFYPLSPFRMLFTDHRGLFVWTPLTLLATIGIALLLRNRARARPFVVTLTAMVTCLLLSYAFFAVWDGGWSFSARYLAAPVPFYALGLARLLSGISGRARLGAATVVGVAVIWSVFLGMSHAFGASQSDGALQVASRHASSSFFNLAWSYSRVRHVFRDLG